MDNLKIEKKFFKKVVSAKNFVFSKEFVKSVLLGQLLSILICGTALTCGLLQKYNVNIPTGQSFFNYILLALVFTTINLKRVGFYEHGNAIKCRGWYYLVLGVVDVEANFMIIKAYQLTSVTSVQLLDCLAIPTILILSRKFLKVNYKWLNYLGVLICLTGACLLVAADVLSERFLTQDNNSVLKSVVGDLLCVGGSLLYGCLNIGQEIMVVKNGIIEYLSMVGCVASVVSALQFFILERDQLFYIDLTITTIWVSMLMFTVCMFAFYSMISYVINVTSAMNANLNLLSSDAFSLLVGIWVFQYKFHWLHFVSFFVILIGVIIYNVCQTKPLQPTTSDLPVTIKSIELQDIPRHESTQDNLLTTPL